MTNVTACNILIYMLFITVHKINLICNVSKQGCGVWVACFEVESESPFQKLKSWSRHFLIENLLVRVAIFLVRVVSESYIFGRCRAFLIGGVGVCNLWRGGVRIEKNSVTKYNKVFSKLKLPEKQCLKYLTRN